MSKTKIGLICIAGLLGIMALGFGGELYSLGMQKFFAPRREAVRRETFEQTKSYRQAQVQEARSMQYEYYRATKDQKDALAAVLLHRLADFPESDMPADVRSFLAEVRADVRNTVIK